jgi:hypothetical protein
LALEINDATGTLAPVHVHMISNADVTLASTRVSQANTITWGKQHLARYRLCQCTMPRDERHERSKSQCTPHHTHHAATKKDRKACKPLKLLELDFEVHVNTFFFKKGRSWHYNVCFGSKFTTICSYKH